VLRKPSSAELTSAFRPGPTPDARGAWSGAPGAAAQPAQPGRLAWDQHQRQHHQHQQHQQQQEAGAQRQQRGQRAAAPGPVGSKRSWSLAGAAAQAAEPLLQAHSAAAGGAPPALGSQREQALLVCAAAAAGARRVLVGRRQAAAQLQAAVARWQAADAAAAGQLPLTRGAAAHLAAQQQHKQQQRQQLVLVAPGAPRAGQLLRPQLQQAARPQALPARLTAAQQLLAWSGSVLRVHSHEAYLMAQHIFKRVAQHIDSALLVSLGTHTPAAAAMLVCLWVGAKCEDNRRNLAGASAIAKACGMLPWGVTSLELHVMQLLNWQPYAGYRVSGPASCTIEECR